MHERAQDHAIIDSLARIPLFESLSQRALAEVAATLRVRELERDELLFQEGDEGVDLFIIVDGRLAVIKSADTPDERLIGHRGPGEYIGELSLLGVDDRRSATIRAGTPARLLQMCQADLHTLLRRYPALASTMLRVLGGRLSAAHDTAISDMRERNERLAQAYAELQAAQAAQLEKERLERDLQVAYEIQMSILPRTMPSPPGYSFGARIVPARIVGGDFFDFIPLGESSIGIAIGDVTDKGLPAAIFMAQARALLRAEASRAVSPKRTLDRVNSHLLQMNDAGLFVTAIYGVLDLASGRFRYARAGHELPLLVSGSGEVTVAPLGAGMALGLVERPPLDEQFITIAPGHTLLLYTDGATDAHTLSNDEFGRGRLAEALASHRRSPALQLCEELLADIAAFQARAHQHDDITLVAIQAR